MQKPNSVTALLFLGVVLIIALKLRSGRVPAGGTGGSPQHSALRGPVVVADRPALKPGAQRDGTRFNPKIREYNETFEAAVQQSQDPQLKRLFSAVTERMPDAWQDTFVLRDTYHAVIGIGALKRADDSFIEANENHIQGISELSQNPKTEEVLKDANRERRTLSAESLQTLRSVLAHRLSLKYPEIDRTQWDEILRIDYAAPPAPLGPLNLISPEVIAGHFGFELPPATKLPSWHMAPNEAKRLLEVER